MFHKLFPEVEIIVSDETNNYELSLTDFQLKKVNVIVHNLVDNAIAFSNNLPVKIDVIIDSNEKWLILSIIDSGIGIPKKNIEQIWEPGVTFRTDALTRPESRGHGLVIVSRIIEELGWEKEVHSIEGHGTQMQIYVKNDNWRKIT